MIFDRLGVLTDEVSQDFAEALDWAECNGMTHVEIRMVGGKNIADFSDQELDQLLFEVEKRGLYVSAVASPIFKCALNPSRAVASGDTFGQEEESVEHHFLKLERVIEICKRLKADKIRIFSFWREQNPSDYEEEIIGYLKKAATAAAEHDALLLLENENSCNGGYASEVAHFVQQVDSPNLKVLWDPGNEEYGGRSAFPEGYDRVKGLIGHVHLKDAFVDKCVPIGEGMVPFIDQLQALEDDGYEGLFTIETHYIPEGGTAKDGTGMTLKGLQNILGVEGKI
ncbi:sugar phosphate isomerase/epimerase family protein [Lederbergia panacisoli]|uniref:sugar phosphate isomerase/epimerase family protein n=1 Tax=Lederbergia panacisoli TaxID=1255251 RepID=UPI00214B3F83|nr:sugar phosphate isomerase/epimerase family protein [Lederbergia panacisoli]MCR2822949.1 sugar phosphate isomerase/epimerase [Lederbergia panacisoli]